nr:T9SS type A sorting domain-containing protein [Bacteroidia bacterium]
TNISGCDSSFITRLNFHPAYTIAIQTGICPGDSAFIYGNWQTIPGIYTDSLTTVNGCDSILLTELIQLPVYNELVTTTICTGDSIFLAGSWQTTAGIYLDSLLSSTGCDSIVNTTLSIVTGDSSSQTISLCNGDSLFLGGNWQTNAGIYADTLQNINGCDSIVTTTLIILATDSISQSYTICSGDSILLSGSWQTITGIYTDTLQNTNGCDSIIYNNLTVLLTDSIYANIGICTGDSIFLAGSWQTTAGLYTEVYQNQNGCDSIRYTNLQVNSLPVVTLTLPDSAICQPDIPYTLTGEFPTGGNWIGSGVSGNIFNPAALPPGMYTIQYEYTDSNGCSATAADSIVYYICSGIQENEIASIGLYPNPASDYLEIQLPENQTLQQRYEIIDSNGRLLDSGVINKQNNRIDIRTLSDGIYLMKIQSEQEIRTGRFIKIK